MDTEEMVRQAIDMFWRSGATPEFSSYCQKIKQEDLLAYSVVEAHLCHMRNQYSQAIKRLTRLLPKVTNRPWLTWRVLLSIGASYRDMGEAGAGETYLLRALEIAELIRDRECVSRTRFHLCVTRLFKGEYEQAEKEFWGYKKDPMSWEPYVADYYLGILAIIKGELARATKLLDDFLKINKGSRLWFAALEMRGLALRILGRLSDATMTFIESSRGLVELKSLYSTFPMAKALELSRLAGLEPPPGKLVRKALGLAKKGSWGEQAAAGEIEALLREDDAEAAEGLYEAAKNYLRAYQNIEAVFSGLTAAYLAWKADSPVFSKALKLIAPLVPLHPGFKKDPILGDFMSEIEPFLTKALKPSQDKEGMKAYLIGEFRVLVDGKEIKMKAWRNNKAIKGLIYLLLSQKHRIPMDHLFYLLWPRRSYDRKSRWGLYKAMDTVRKHLGRRELLTKRRDFYQLEDTWTDLGEIENLVRLADATIDPAEKEEYLARARELAKGELLPEFPYDKHIEEYRQYYNRLRKRLFGE